MINVRGRYWVNLHESAKPWPFRRLPVLRIARIGAEAIDARGGAFSARPPTFDGTARTAVPQSAAGSVVRVGAASVLAKTGVVCG